MEARNLARGYEKTVRPHWEDQFVPFLLESFPESLPAKASLLEMGCTTGRFTQEILSRLPADGRLIAVEDVSELMEIARRKVAAADHKQVFFKHERPDALTFADDTFHGVLASGLATSYDLDTVIAEAYRLLKHNGFVLLGTVLQGSFQELLDIFREVLEKEDLTRVQDGLDRLSSRLLDRRQVSRLLSRAGLVACRVQVQPSTVHFESGLKLLGSPLVRQHCLDECLSLIKDRGWREGVVAGMIRALDTYFPNGIDLNLVLGKLEGTKL